MDRLECGSFVYSYADSKGIFVGIGIGIEIEIEIEIGIERVSE
jgi:hypothetical protein